MSFARPSRRPLMIVSAVSLGLALVLWVMGERARAAPAEPSQQTTAPTVSASSLPMPAVPSSPAVAQPTAGVPACGGRTGKPTRVAITGLGVDTRVEQLREENGSIGDPVEKDNLGWFPAWPGVQPGAGRGAVLLTGHTYHDNSAVFKESFASTNKVGMLVTLTLEDGSTCRYRVAEQLTVDADGYQQVVDTKDLYDLDRARPERLLIATCSGWDGRRHTSESLLMADPAAAPGA